jgi:hypothetical protein
VGVWAGDDSPSKRDRQPSLCAYALRARREAAALSRKRGNKKAQFPRSATNRGRLPLQRQPSKHSNGDNLVSALNHDSCNVSVYSSVDFVNLKFVTYWTPENFVTGPN